MRRTISRIFISTILLALASVSGAPVFGQGAAGLSWNTFLGSALNDQGLAVAVDANGNSYVTGWSLETWGDPVRPFYGDLDFANAFVAKLDRNGTLVWNTFLGDIDWAEGSGIAVDANGYLYVVGRSATWWDAEGDTRDDFPGADGTSNVFVAKLDPNGALLWHTFLGGTGDDYGQGIALDAAGSSYVAGTSYTAWGAPVQAYAGGAEAFAAKLDADGNLLWSTFLGQTGIDFGRGIGTDASGNAYVIGFSAATWGPPIAALTFKGGYDAFVAKLDTYGYRQWNVFLGASLYDYGYGIAVDGSGNSYIGGMSWSTWGSPIDAFGGGGRDAFAAKVSANGALLWNTFLGGTQYDYGYAIDIDAGGNAYVTGSSSASWGTPFRTFTGGDDAFVAKLGPSGSRLWNCFLGGVYEDAGRGVAADASGSAHIAGYSDSTWGAPVRPFDATGDGEEAFAAKIVSLETKADFVGTWDDQGVYYRNSDTGGWVKLASPATMITAGDLDGDGIDDLVGIWPTQGGVWVKSSSTGAWARLSTTATHIAAGDMNGDGRDDLLGTWDGQGVFYRDSLTGTWVQMATPATMITAGDLDGDDTDDLIGIWPSQGGVWVKYSSTGAWARLASTARDIAAGDVSGDGRDDLLATWEWQGVYYRDSVDGAWIKMATEADQVTCGDLDSDGAADLIGIWPSQGGVWVKYSETAAWERLSTTARDIGSGVMRAEGETAAASLALFELPLPVGGTAETLETSVRKSDLSMSAPGGWRFPFKRDRNLVPHEENDAQMTGVPGPGDPGFEAGEQKNLVPEDALSGTERPKRPARMTKK